MYSTSGCEIPSAGRVEMAWVQTPFPPVSLATVKKEGDADAAMDEGDAMITTSSPADNGGGYGGPGGGKEIHENIDYDVADDNDWGPQ